MAIHFFHDFIDSNKPKSRFYVFSKGGLISNVFDKMKNYKFRVSIDVMSAVSEKSKSSFFIFLNVILKRYY